MSETTQRAGWLDRISIRRKLIGAFVIVLGLFATATAATSWFARNLDDARVITDHTYDVLVAVESMRSGMWAQESGLRGYVITGDEAFLAPYTGGKQRFQQALNQLQRLTIDNDAQQARLSRVAEYEKRWQSELVEPEFELLSQGRVEEAQQVIADSQGKALLDVLRGLFEEISLTE